MEEIISSLLGIIVGTITGLIPGLHINLVATILTASFIATINPLAAAIFIASLAITHTILDFIPSIFLGAAEEDTFLSTLPGHEMLKQGKGYEAAAIAMIGALTGIAIGSLGIFILIPSIKFFSDFSQQYIPWILLIIILYVSFREEKIIPSILVLILSGFLGFLTFHLPIEEPLLPILSGMFGISGLITSLDKKITIPPQSITKLKEINLENKEKIKSTIGAIIASIPFSFLPALGAGYGSLIVSEVTSVSRKTFLFLNGLMNSSVMILSFSVAIILGKTRTGAAAAISQLAGIDSLYTILSYSLISGCIATIFGIWIAKKSSRLISNAPYRKISLAVIVLITIVVSIISGPSGIIVFLTSTFLGIFTIRSNIKRSNLMGALVVPTIIYYLS